MKFNLALVTGAFVGFFFHWPQAFCTTFGPIPVVDQLQNAQYVVRGSIVGSGWVEPEPRLQRPYTYWRLNISEQSLGEALPASISIRQPGGELGDIGYHVAGTAEFTPNEDIFVLLRDTDQAGNIKEVIGLASGKYRVERAPNGKTIVKSGLGLPVTGDDGRVFTPEDFGSLARRVAKKETTPEDRNIFVNRRAVHEQQTSADQQSERTEESARKALDSIWQRKPAESQKEGISSSSQTKENIAVNTSNPSTNSVQESASKAEEPTTGTAAYGWALAVLMLLALLLGVVFIARR